MEGYTEVFAWGLDNYGQLGLGGKARGKTYTVPRFCSYNVIIRDISCGEEHSAFISQQGHVYSMGSNTDGKLGIADRSLRQSSSPCLVEDLASYRIAGISCGFAHTVAITEQGLAFSWGQGEHGALGISTLESQWAPVQMEISEIIRVKQASCGSRHTSIIAEKDYRRILMTCGSGEAGQLGTGKREKELIPVTIQSGEDVKQVSSGVYHTMYVTVNGRVYVMGGNSFGQLGTGDKKSYSRPERISYLDGVYIDKVSAGQHSAAISDKGHLYVWGTGAFGEYLIPQRFNSGIGPIKDVSVGGSFGVALDSAFNTYIWGSNSNGELGLGDIEPRAAPALIFHLKDKQVRHIACGGNFFLGLGSDVEPSINEPSLRTRKSTPERVHDLRYVQAQREVTNRKIDTSFTSGFKYSDEASVKVKRNKENRNSPYVAKHDILNQAAQKRKGGVTRKSLEKRKQSVSRERNGKDVDISFESQRNGSNRHNEVIKLEKINPPVYANGRARREHSMSGIDFELEQHEMPDRPRSTTPFHNHDMNREADISLQRSEFMARDKEREFRDENMRKDEILQDLEFQLELKEREIEKLNHEVSLLTSQFYESKVDLEKLNRNAHSENSRAEDLMRENDDLKADVHRMKQENEQIKLNHNSISRDYQMVDTQYILKVKTLEAQLDHKSGELERMHVYANQLSNNIKILENENKDFNQKLHDETTKAASSESSIEEMSIQILRLRTEIEQVHAKSRESETQNRSLGTETLGLRQSLDDAKIQNRAQNSEIAALRQSLNETNQQLQKALDDLQFSRKTNEEMRLQISHVDGGSKFLREENSRIKRSLDELEVVSKSEAQKYESLIARLKETQESDRQSYEHKLESERQNRLKLENDLHILKNEKSKTENEVHLMIQEKNSVENKLKESQSHLDSESFKLAQYQSRYESDNKRLQLELESLKRDYSELRVVVNNTQHENSQLNSTISNTDIDFKKMRDENWSLKQEISELNRRVQNLAGENEDIRVIYQEFKAQSDETVTLIGQENNLLNQNIDDMKYETEKLQQQINDKLGTIENLYMMNREWEDRFNSVIMENQGLQKEVNDLESKNKHLFETLERELGQRAKEYKERTLTMLNTPNKNTVSPYIARANVVVVPSPRESVKRKSPTHESQDRIGNAAERLLEALNESPIRDSRNTSPMRKGSDFFNERQKILPAKDLSLTPQRSDLNSRISALMQSRAKLKELDNGL